MLLGLMRVFAHAPILRALPIQLGKAPTMAASPDTELTIVVPAYNEEINITGCLARLFASSPPCMSWKVLLVDDGSTDGTWEEIMKIKKKSKNKVFTIKRNKRNIK